MFAQFIRFASVGVVGTTVHYFTLVILVESTVAGPVLSSCFGFILGAFTNYYLNYRYTFRSDKHHHRALPKFMLIAIVGLAINSGIMRLGTSFFPVQYLVVQIFATGLVLIWNFAGNRIWTFSECPDSAR
jgi:putative flippase GtrA